MCSMNDDPSMIDRPTPQPPRTYRLSGGPDEAAQPRTEAGRRLLDELRPVQWGDEMRRAILRVEAEAKEIGEAVGRTHGIAEANELREAEAAAARYPEPRGRAFAIRAARPYAQQPQGLGIPGQNEPGMAARAEAAAGPRDEGLELLRRALIVVRYADNIDDYWAPGESVDVHDLRELIERYLDQAER